MQNLLYESDRRIAVEWARMPEQNAGRATTYPVKLTVHCDDRAGMLKEITAVISDENTNIRSVETHPGDNGDAMVEFVIDAEDVRHLNLLVQGLRRLPGVRDVHRSQKL